MWCLDASSFTISLSGRKDRNFYLYPQLCQYLFRLARRCSNPSDIPEDKDWPAILNLDIKAVTALTVSDFISRIKFGSRLRVACRAMAKKDIREKKDQGLPIDALANKNIDDFGRSARSYISHLFSSVQNQKTLTTDLKKGLGSFDLDTLLHDPLPHAVYCFSQLFTSFRLRGYFSLDQETECQEEYVSFRLDLRRKYPELHQRTLFVLDTVGFLIEQTSLQIRPLLLKLFRLACLCLGELFQTLPPVKFSSVDSDDPTSGFVDVVLPVQSYFRNVPNGIESIRSICCCFLATGAYFCWSWKLERPIFIVSFYSL